MTTRKRSNRLANRRKEAEADIDPDRLRSAASEALRESEETARALLNATTDSAFLMEPDGTLILLNEETARRLGKPVDELVGRCAYDFLPPDVAEHRRSQVKQLIRSGKPLRFEDTRGDRIIDSSMYPVFDEQGKVTRLAIFGRDITERVHTEATRAQMEKEVRKSERLFRQTFETIPDPSILWKREPDGRIVLRMVNPAAREMSRGNIERFLDATVEDFFKDAPNVAANIRRAFGADEPIRVELRYRLRTTGEDKWVMADYAKVSEDYVLNTIRDITERVEAEQALRERQALLSKAETMAHLGSWEWTIKTDQITVSDGWQRIHGCSASHLSPEDLLPLAHPDDRPAVERALENSLETGEPYSMEHRIIRQDNGEVRFVKADGEVVCDGGEPVRMYGASQDITARMRAEANITRASNALRESEERFRTLFNRLSDPVFIHRGDDGRIILANDMAFQRYEYSPEEMTKLTPQDFDTHEYAALVPERLTNLHQEGRTMFETLHRTKSGQVFPVEVNAHMTIYKGEPVLITVCRDITQRKRMEGALRESNRRLRETLTELKETQEQMVQRERLAAVGQLAAGIAHDFRNLLTTIILCADMGLRKHDLPPDLGQDLGSILSESRKAAELVQQILDFSSRSMIDARPVDLKALTEGASDILRRTIPESIQLFLDISPAEASFTIAADPSRIEQALINLSLNARDAMPQGGELRIGLERIVLKPGEVPPVPEAVRHSETTEEIPGSRSKIQRPKSKIEHRAWICLSISDTGTGMSKQVQAHLFEPFFTTKEVGQGTGLGLAQVYGIVRQHEGYIDVETEVGKGTTFRIYLPAFEEEEKAAHSSEEERDTYTPHGRGEVILLVEDNDKVREAGQSILESLGYRTLVAANGREALSVYEAEGGANLVITDMVMPEMGGKQLVQQLRRMDPNLRALGLTGYAVQESARESREIGFVDVIHKPFRVQALARAIRRALDEA